MTSTTERAGAALQLFAPVAESIGRYARLLSFAPDEYWRSFLVAHRSCGGRHRPRCRMRNGRRRARADPALGDARSSSRPERRDARRGAPTRGTNRLERADRAPPRRAPGAPVRGRQRRQAHGHACSGTSRTRRCYGSWRVSGREAGSPISVLRPRPAPRAPSGARPSGRACTPGTGHLARLARDRPLPRSAIEAFWRRYPSPELLALWRAWRESERVEARPSVSAVES